MKNAAVAGWCADRHRAVAARRPEPAESFGGTTGKSEAMAPPFAVRGFSWVTRNFTGLPGRWRIVRWLERQGPTFAALPHKTVRFARGYRMRVDPVDENGRRVYINGYQPEERLTRHFRRLLRSGDCVIDVGANVGYYTMVAARAVGTTGCVHAFEPSPSVLPLLQANAALNPHAKICVHGQAVTDHCGEVQFHTATADRRGYSSIRDLGVGTASVATVKAVSLDSVLTELPSTRLVKVDVEGAELLVLKGMQRLIERDRPFLILEIDDTFLREMGADAQQQCDFLREADYELYRIIAKGALQRVASAPSDRCNLFACPREKHNEVTGQP